MQQNFSTAVQSEKTNSLFYFIVVVVFTALICSICYFLFFYPTITELRNKLFTKEEEVRSLETLNKEQASELADIHSELLQARESVVTLEREMTTFSGSDNSDNLINQNSLFTTIQIVELRAEPKQTSDVVHTIEKEVTGEVIDGPRLVNDEIWWKVSFRTDQEGWVNEELLERVPSVVIRIDLDQDGEPDMKIRWEGEYDLSGIVAEPGTDGTYVRYKGEAMPEPYQVIEL